MKLPDKVYDVLKWIMILGMPVATFIIGIIDAVNTSSPAAIVTAVFGGLATLAGIIIKASDITYKKSLSSGEDK